MLRQKSSGQRYLRNYVRGGIYPSKSEIKAGKDIKMTEIMATSFFGMNKP